ncbi:phage Gp37/Gp68 family protein [Verminephrobacter aporrectodeae subsp. tuberculatae]|uniref:Phage Gp37/Gp68 family protein n=1 Tax=Verminephrobacter aporrectodeae subsp. tuberculatae TaxID=1110392 RepID=A0ABT3KR09_9BURK|nr:phage Gp37/Gp68 family protein [Verminephrobacter aporrectodeae]MCW5320572.1 phage Gp37/Gp68 family protein [Verminephrobacter aporrectodeae subsp. tuberculatae]
MAKDTKIEWAHHTFNPWLGCTKVSPACDHCYAEAWAKRSGMVQWGAHTERRRTSEHTWTQPIKWNAEAESLGVRARVFCASLADVFDNAVPTTWRMALFDLIARTPHIDWMLLTKRIGNVRKMCADDRPMFDMIRKRVWLGATVCNQEEANRDIPRLLAAPARQRFLSVEPLLGSVDVFSGITGELLHTSGDDYDPGAIDWVIVGGESGPGARPMHPAWVRSLRDQCRAAGVPFFFKQHGEWLATEFIDDGTATIAGRRIAYVRPDGSSHDGSEDVAFFGDEEQTAWVGKKAAGRRLDGRVWDEVPK